MTERQKPNNECKLCEQTFFIGKCPHNRAEIKKYNNGKIMWVDRKEALISNVEIIKKMTLPKVLK